MYFTVDREMPLKLPLQGCSYSTLRHEVTRSHKRTKDVVTIDAFSRAQMRLAARLLPDPLGELERSPRPLAATGVGVLLLRGRERRGG